MDDKHHQPTTPIAPILLSEGEFYDAARRRIEQEDSLNVNRLTWLMGSQSFLFSAFAGATWRSVFCAPRNNLPHRVSHC
jgi:hypothetical protein